MLALFVLCGKGSLSAFLDGIFESAEKSTLTASDAEIAAFNAFMEQYKKGLAVEKLASEVL